MKKLTIHHIGPIKHVELTLKRINVVIGPLTSSLRHPKIFIK